MNDVTLNWLFKFFITLTVVMIVASACFGINDLLADNVKASNTPANYERRVLRALETIADEQEKQSRHMKQCVCK